MHTDICHGHENGSLSDSIILQGVLAIYFFLYVDITTPDDKTKQIFIAP